MSRRARASILVVVALGASLARSVSADAPPPDEPPPEDSRSALHEGDAPPAEDPDEPTVADRAEEPPPPRDVPNYDGRPPPPTRRAERAAWVPRILAFPLYLVAEFVVRRPLGFLLQRVDPERVLRFFRLGPEERITLAPTFSYDFGFRPHIGLLFRARDVGAPGHSISANAAFGGKRWYAGRITESFTPEGSPTTYSLMAEALSRPDGLFYGIGSEVDEDMRARYHWVGTQAALGVTRRFLRQSHATFRTGHRFRTFDDDVGDRISIEERIAQGAPYELPPGYVDGYSIWFFEGRAELDSREARPAPGTGARLTLSALGALDVRDGPDERSFFVYGGSLSGYVDLTGVNHVLALTGTVAFSDAVRGAVPFTELPTLAGDGPLGGFLRPFLLAESGAALSATYTWPIWVYLDGKLDVSVGNGFDGHLANFAPGRLRLSSTIGVAAFLEREHFLQVAFGFGTDEFEDGPNVDQYRFVIGASQSF